MSEINVNTIAQEDALVKALVTDLSGGFKEIIFPSKHLPELLSPGIAYDGSSFAGINNINASDAILAGVEATLVAVPESIAESEKPEYWIICNILNTKHEPHPNCGRGKLIALQKELAHTWNGGQLFMGAEPEAFFVAQTNKETLGNAGGGNGNYFNPKDPKSFIIAEISNTLDDMDYQIERAHTEVGDDQFEINWRFDTAERTADKIQIFKLVAHKIARNYELDVTFLPKPYPSRNGSGMHCHLSVQNEAGNLFYDANATDQKQFSTESLQFLTGILNNARSICAIANSAEVSYSRLVPGFEAPCIVALGEGNRSAACRIPAIPNADLKKYAIRTEMRFPDPLCNPYLLAASFIAAGLIGLEEEVDFIGFTEENLYEYGAKEVVAKGYTLLPRNLWEAYQAFSANIALKNKLGASITEAYEDLLLDEIDGCQPFANPESVRRHYLD
jgi:glutamine synthetase